MPNMLHMLAMLLALHSLGVTGIHQTPHCSNKGLQSNDHFQTQVQCKVSTGRDAFSPSKASHQPCLIDFSFLFCKVSTSVDFMCLRCRLDPIKTRGPCQDGGQAHSGPPFECGSSPQRGRAVACSRPCPSHCAPACSSR